VVVEVGGMGSRRTPPTDPQIVWRSWPNSLRNDRLEITRRTSLKLSEAGGEDVVILDVGDEEDRLDIGHAAMMYQAMQAVVDEAKGRYDV
jgi:hypothetical protein